MAGGPPKLCRNKKNLLDSFKLTSRLMIGGFRQFISDKCFFLKHPTLQICNQVTSYFRIRPWPYNANMIMDTWRPNFLLGDNIVSWGKDNIILHCRVQHNYYQQRRCCIYRIGAYRDSQTHPTAHRASIYKIWNFI